MLDAHQRPDSVAARTAQTGLKPVLQEGRAYSAQQLVAALQEGLGLDEAALSEQLRVRNGYRHGMTSPDAHSYEPFPVDKGIRVERGCTLAGYQSLLIIDGTMPPRELCIRAATRNGTAMPLDVYDPKGNFGPWTSVL